MAFAVVNSVIAIAAAASLLASGPAGAQSGPAGAKLGAPALTNDDMRASLTRAWADATDTWRRILGDRQFAETPHINFVPAIRPSHCYGLYINAGPVYCSGNSTVFVSLDEMKRLSARFGGDPAGLAFLVAHELGHHVQKLTGRFRILSSLVRSNPRLQRELSLRFELEADCLAGVWASNSAAFAANANVRRTMLTMIEAIGDDKVQIGGPAGPDASTFTHGASEQRIRWYRAGLQAGAVSACRVLEADEF